MSQNIDLNRDHLTTSDAAKRADLHGNYLAQLARQGKLEGFKMGREWFIYTDSLEKFLAMPRKSGPKGPRQEKKPSSKNVTSTSGKENLS